MLSILRRWNCDYPCFGCTVSKYCRNLPLCGNHSLTRDWRLILQDVIPNFAAITVLEEAVDLAVELLQLKRNEVLLVENQQFHTILENFFCRKRLEIRVC